MEKYGEYSKYIDSLEFLLLPVKRENNYLHKEYLLSDKYLNFEEININTHNKIKRLEKSSHETPKAFDLETLSSTKLPVNSRFHNSCKITQSSTSNQENSIRRHQFEHKILRRKKGIKEGIYHKIKTTESSCDIKYMTKYENILNKRGHITDLFIMDKNSRKEKKQKNARLKLNDNIQCRGSKCTCSENSHEFTDVERCKSRVTIFGQVGLTEDDRYVLNCAATLNDKPIRNNVMYMDNEWKFCRAETDNAETKTTQATQVNFNFSKETPIKNLKNKSVQCYCNNTQSSNIETFVSKIEPHDIELKQCKSPLVVISVYPRQDSVEIIDKTDPIKIIRHQVSPKNKTVFRTKECNTIQTKEEKKSKVESTLINTKRKFAKSRSPSPAPETVKEKNNNTDTKFILVNNSLQKQPSLRQKSADKSVHKHNKIAHNINNLGSCSKNVSQPGFNSKQQSGFRQTNKEQVKKALVNTFLKNVSKTNNSLVTKNLFGPKEDASKITIDINGEKEDYSVFLEQRKFDTGLCVRKTTKDPFYREKNYENSKKKLVPMSDSAGNEDKRYYKNTCCINTRVILVMLIVLMFFVITNVYRITTLDVERTRRQWGREDRNSSRIEPKRKERNVSEPNKHYRGDNCSITNPIERDQEIRKLLGVLREKQCQDREETDVGICVMLLLLAVPALRLYLSRSPKDFFIPNSPLNKSLPKKGKRKNIWSADMPTKYHETQKVRDNVYFVKISKTDNDIDREIASENNAKFNSFSVNNASLKIQNILSSYVKKENISPNIQVILQIEKNNPIVLTKKQYEKVKKIIKNTFSKKSIETAKKKRYQTNDIDRNVISIGTIKMKRKLQQKFCLDRETQTENILKCVEIHYNSRSQNTLVQKGKARDLNKNVLNIKEQLTKENIDPRKVLSSMGVRCANVEYVKHVSLSSQHFGIDPVNTFQYSNMHNDNKSLHTIFKGQRKCVTPNLGTSAFSLNSNSTNDSMYSIKSPHHFDGEKVKKPFIQRLMSCLVMRSARAPDFKDMVNQRQKLPSRNTSLDSYNISTSLGALEMSSSIYDSSASFYSNHTIIPINKTKRGFFNSVRGFLTIRRN
ncbi:unnamed protein product [Euphydryas editha]|uniref:Uncharacterized protein n=1 Tax=Euphydryas editha TaxID=104508 RepID=A0AAU9U337_EUPED|nr:unnamed protein product [Euphydryas editha]